MPLDGRSWHDCNASYMFSQCWSITLPLKVLFLFFFFFFFLLSLFNHSSICASWNSRSNLQLVPFPTLFQRNRTVESQCIADHHFLINFNFLFLKIFSSKNVFVSVEADESLFGDAEGFFVPLSQFEDNMIYRSTLQNSQQSLTSVVLVIFSEFCTHEVDMENEYVSDHKKQ